MKKARLEEAEGLIIDFVFNFLGYHGFVHSIQILLEFVSLDQNDLEYENIPFSEELD